MNELSAFIAKYRNEKNLSQRRVAELANISHTEINRIENGERRNPSPPVLKSIANALGVTYDAIMQAAGYIDSTSDSPIIAARITGTEDLTDFEIEEVKNFINYLRSKRI